MKYKTIGIVGGVGPYATVDFERKLLECSGAVIDQDHPTIITVNNPSIPDRTAALLRGGESPVPEMTRTARTLKDAGAEVLCIPCNTAHAFLEEVERELGGGVQIVNMIHVVVEDILRTYQGIRSVGILCTDGTRAAALYDAYFLTHGVTTLYPSVAVQRNVMEAIYGAEGIKAGHMEYPKLILSETANALADEGAEVVIMACTEIPLVLTQAAVPLVDPNELLARTVLSRALIAA